MEIVSVVIIYLIVFVGVIILVYAIIKHATSRELLEREALRQSLYLRQLALKNGVSEEVLESIDHSLDKNVSS